MTHTCLIENESNRWASWQGLQFQSVVRLRQEDCQFMASLGNLMRPCLKIKNGPRHFASYAWERNGPEGSSLGVNLILVKGLSRFCSRLQRRVGVTLSGSLWLSRPPQITKGKATLGTASSCVRYLFNKTRMPGPRKPYSCCAWVCSRCQRPA